MTPAGDGRHLRVVRAEFARQAESFARSETLGAPALTTRIAEALAGAPVPRLLDVACGPGVLTPALAPRAGLVVGLDLTVETLRLARTRAEAAGVANAAWLRGVAEQLPLRDASFGAAVLRLALHHFERPVSVLREVRRVLRPGGRLVVLDVLTADDPPTAEMHNAIERLRDPSHAAFVSRSELIASIHRAGFAVERDETWATPRHFDEWARIIAETTRMAALEVVLRRLAEAGVSAGVDLRVRDGALQFTYDWCLCTAVAAGADAAPGG